MNYSITHHAEARMQQRGISEDIVDIIDTFGIPEHDHHGGIRMMIPKKQINNLINKQPMIKGLLEKAKGVYLVLSSDCSVIITAGHYYR